MRGKMVGLIGLAALGCFLVWGIGPAEPPPEAGPESRSSQELEPVAETSVLLPPPVVEERRPGRGLRVRVLSLGAGPIAGVLAGLGQGDVRREGRTDEHGYAVFEDLDPGPAVLGAVIAPGHEPAPPRAVEIPQEGWALVEIRLEPQLRLRALVLRFDGKPAEGAELLVDEVRAGRADARGGLRFSARLGARVTARHPEHGEATAVVDPAAAAARFFALRLVPPGAGGLEGVVLDELGAPVLGATVRARAGHGPPFSTVSGEAGRFAFAVPDGGYEVRAADSDGRSASVANVVAPAAGLVLRFAPGATLDGEVRSDGAVVPRFVVRWASEGTPGSERQVYAEDGRFSIPHLPAGPVTVDVEAEPGAATVRTVLPEGGRGFVSVELEGLAAVEGVVRDADTAEAIAGAVVRLEGRAGLGRGPSVTTGPDGSFRLAGLRPGRRSVAASAEGYRTRIFSALELDSNDTAPLSAELRRSVKPRGLELVGVGAVMGFEDGALVVSRVVEGAAAEGQLPVGSRVLAVDGRPVTELGLDGAIQAIRGEPGTPVQLSVDLGSGPTLITLLRRRVEM